MLVHLSDDTVLDVAEFVEADAAASALGLVAGLSKANRTACDRAVRDHEACALALARSIAAIVTRTAARNNPQTVRSA